MKIPCLSRFSPCLLPETGKWRWEYWHWGLLLLGLGLRLAYSFSLNREDVFGGWDGKEYLAYAQNLMSFKGDDYPRFFNMVRPPFYPIFLIPFIIISPDVLWPVQCFQSFMGVAQAMVLADIAGRWAGRRAGNWALALSLLHPYLIYYCAFILTETLFICLLWMGIACLQRLTDKSPTDPWRLVVWSGVALGLACLTRPALQLFLPAAAIGIGVLAWRQTTWLHALARMTGFTAVVSLLLLPWLLGNMQVYGQFTLAASRDWPAFFSDKDLLKMYEARTKKEYYDEFYRILTSPRSFVRQSPMDWSIWTRLQRHKFIHFWRPWLNPVIYSRTQVWLSAIATTPLFALATLELWRRRRSRDVFLWLLLALVITGYITGGFLFHVQIRYRIPFVDVAFLLLAAAALSRWTWQWESLSCQAENSKCNGCVSF